MAEPKATVTLTELMVSTLAMTDALSKLLIEKGINHWRGVQAKTGRGAGDISGDSKVDRAVTADLPIGEILTGYSLSALVLARGSMVAAV
jgi:hypothetical protein